MYKTTTALEALLEQLDRIAELAPGWNDYDSPAISEKAIATARALIIEAANVDQGSSREVASPYTVVAMDGGGVQIDYRNPRCDLEALIGPGGELGYVLIDKTGPRKSYTEGEGVDERQILELIRR